MNYRVLVWLFIFFAPANAFAIGAAWPLSDTPRFWILGEGLGHFSVDSYYFQTSENYDNQGIASAPATLDHLQYTNLRAHGAFGFAPKLSLFAQADARALFMSSTSQPPATNMGPGDAFVGLRWLLYRSSSSDRVYPTEWSPESFVLILESTWNFPMYDASSVGKPPLGDQSNDFSGIARSAWYTNEWLAFSAGTGYIYRTAGYAPSIPWNIRADISLQQHQRFRFWTEFQSFQSFQSTGIVLNNTQPDPIPNGSLLFKSYAPTIRTATLGLGYLLSREWEITAGGSFTATGVNSAKGWGGGLGFTWRPYQVPEIKYEDYRKRQIERLQSQEHEVRRRPVVKYGFRATIVKVSTQGNYVKISYGAKDRVRVGDPFYIMPPDMLNAQARRPLGFATVVQVQPDASFLQVMERFNENLSIQEGYEARRIFFDAEE